MDKSIRDIYGEALAVYGKDNPRVVVLDADVSNSTKSCLFAEKCPERFLNCGISEAAMMGIAAGLATAGKIPVVNTFSVFMGTIASLFARTYLSYSGLNVKLMGAFAGISAGFDGPTHHALEDIAVMRALPGMTVLVPSDERMTRWLVKTALETDGPMYIRLSREPIACCHAPDTAFTLGKGCVVRQGTDAVVLACGAQVAEACKAADILAAKGIHIKVVDMFTIKPLDKALVLESAEQTGLVITAEEHNVIGGLGSAVAEVLAQHNSNASLHRLGLQDCHAESGAYPALLRKYGLDAHAIVNAVEAGRSKAL